MIPQKPVSKAYSLPSPIGGWNARDSLADMKIMDAPVMDNWFPLATALQVRQGYTVYATGLTGTTETLLTYNGLASNQFFAATSSGDIFDVSSSGAVGAADVTGLSNGRFEYVNTTNAGGNWLIAVNGVNLGQRYDGAAWTDLVTTGITSDNFIHCEVYKSRVWFVEKGSLSAWYLGVDAVAGAATEFALQSVANKGGYLNAVATWTIDAGYGVDDYLCFITSQGEVIIYRLDDPTDISGIQLIGVFQIGEAISRRCYIKYAGDLLLINNDGVVPMSGSLQSSRVNPRVALTDKIQQAMQQAATVYGGNFGWQLKFFPRENQLYLNVPAIEPEQYVMNTITGAWCRFTGWDAHCLEIYNEDLYFGSVGTVCKGWDGFSDNDTDINAFCLQAFDDFGSNGVQKRFTMMLPRFLSNGAPSILGEINVDFDLSDSTASLSVNPVSYATWDSGLWDMATWGGGLQPQQNWQGITGIGYYGAVAMKAASNGIEIQWMNTTVVAERGGIL